MDHAANARKLGDEALNNALSAEAAGNWNLGQEFREEAKQHFENAKEYERRQSNEM